MAKTAQLSIRIDENLKNQSSIFFENIGISFNQGIQLLLKQAIKAGKIELVSEYNAETLAAIAETEAILAHPEKHQFYSSVDEMFEDVLKEQA